MAFVFYLFFLSTFSYPFSPRPESATFLFATMVKERGSCRVKERCSFRVKERGSFRVKERGSCRVKEHGSFRVKEHGSFRVKERGMDGHAIVFACVS